MSDSFYSLVVTLGRHPFWLSSRPTVLHADHVPRTGPVIIAASHTSPYDVPLLMRHTPRRLDFVSTTDIFRKPLVGWFFGNMNAFPLDRSRADSKTVRVIIDRLQRGRAVAMFPEGRIRSVADSVLSGGSTRRGTAGLARLAGAPIVPAVVDGGGAYTRAASWLPLRRVRYGVIFGKPMHVATDADQERCEAELQAAYPALLAELRASMSASARASTAR